MPNLFFVIDTNCFISANLIKNSTSAQAFDRALRLGSIALSSTVFNEYVEVIYRKKLDKYLSEDRRKEVLRRMEFNSTFFSPSERVKDCLDPKDNMFLELALACNAKCIISGDSDLLDLTPYRKIPIIRPDQFLMSYT